MNKNIELKALRKYVSAKDEQKIKKISSQIHPSDMAHELSSFNLTEVKYIFSVLESDIASEILNEVNEELQYKIITTIKKSKITNIFDLMPADEIVDILENFNGEKHDLIFSKLSQEKKRKVSKILKYDEDSVGYHMSLNFVSVRASKTVSQARDEIKEQLKDGDELNGTVFVIGEGDILIGSLKIEDFTIASGKTNIDELVVQTPAIEHKDSLTILKQHSQKYEMESIPVVNKNQKLIGVIESTTMVELLTENKINSTLQSKTKAGKKVKEYTPYFERSTISILKERTPWILILLFVGLFTQVIIMGFQLIWGMTGYWTVSVGSTVIISLAFSSALSIASSINDSSGNTGTQSATVIIESIALGEIESKDSFKMIRKETNIGFWTGLIIGFASIFRTYIVWAMFGLLGGNTSQEALGMFLIASVAAVSFWVSIMFGNFIGAVMPALGMKFNWNSAIVSGPLLTTAIDIFVFAFYLGITTAIFVPLGFANPPADTAAMMTNNIEIFESITNFIS